MTSIWTVEFCVKAHVPECTGTLADVGVSDPARVLVISMSDLARDPRVDRQIEFLSEEFEVVAAGFGPPRQDIEFHRFDGTIPDPEIPEPEVGDGPVLGPGEGGPSAAELVRRTAARAVVSSGNFVYWRSFRARRVIAPYPRRYWMDTIYLHQARQLLGIQADLAVVNDAWFLPIERAIGQGRPVVFDAHEYAPSEHVANLVWRIENGPIARAICRHEIPRLAGMMTVSPGRVDAYHDLCGVEAELVTSAPWFEDLEPRPLEGRRVRMVHWGGADPQRRLEVMIDAMALLDERFSLDMILVPGVSDYITALTQRAAGDPRIRFLEPVPMPELARFGNAYDVGLYPLPPLHINQQFALPNKFFEFVQARLAVAIGPSPDMAHIARQHDFGILSEDVSPASVASALRTLTPERLWALKCNAHAAAHELSAEHNTEIVRDLVRRALTHPAPGIASIHRPHGAP